MLVNPFLPEGGSGETKSPQHTVELMVLLDFPDSHRPTTHWKYNIVSLLKRNYYNILSFGLDVSPHPVVDNERLTGRLGSTGPRRGITQFTNYLQKNTNNVNITNYHLIMKDMK